MAVSAVKLIVVDGKEITQTVDLRTTKQGSASKIKAINGGKFILAEADSGAAPENITARRVGNNLHVSLQGTGMEDPELIIENYYSQDGQEGALVGVAEDGAYYDYIASDAESDHELGYLADGVSSPQVLGGRPLVGFGSGLVPAAGLSWLGLGLFGLGALGLVGAAIAAGNSGGGGGGGGLNPGDGGNGGNPGDGGGNPGDGGGNPGNPGDGGGGNPGKLVIGDIIDNVGDKTGPIPDGGSTDDTTPTIIGGGGTPGKIVTIIDNGKPIGSTIVDDDGNWEFTPTDPLPEGDHHLVVIEDGKEPSDGRDIIVDTTAPGQVSIDSVLDDVGSMTGYLTNGQSTDDTTPTLSGKAEAGSTVTVYDNGVLLGSTIANADGAWTFEPTTALPDGDHNFTATATDAAGNVGLPSTPWLVVIDTNAGTAEIGDVEDNVGPIQGHVPSGGSTDDNTPTLSGGGGGIKPGDTVIISDGGTPIGSTIVRDDGKWSFTPDTPLPDGKHDFTVVITDPAGNISAPSDPWIVIVDTQAPDAPRIVSVIDDQGAVTGPLISGGAPTDDAQPQIIGTAEANSTVMIYDGATLIGSAPVDASGNWSFTPTTPLTNGGHSLTAKASDAAGNISDPSNEFDLTVDTGGVPTATAITGIFDNVGSHTGNIEPNGVTDDNQPEIHGTARPGSIVSIFSDGLLLGTVTADATTGDWSFTPDIDHALSDGLHNITASSTTATGNAGPLTGNYPITIDTIAPAASTGDTLTDDVGPVTGEIHDNDTTDDPNPDYAGKAEPGSTITIYDNGVIIGTAITNGAGDWSFTPKTPLTDGTHEFTNTVTDEAGNTSPVSTPIHFTVDTSAVSIAITLVTDDVGSVTGPISNHGPTDDTRPTVSGIATANSVVHIFVDGVEIGSTTSNGLGRWSFEPDAAHALIEGPHTITATVTNAAGVTSNSNPFDLVVDLTAPDKPVIGEVIDDVGTQTGPIPNGGDTDDNTPTLTGGGLTPGDTVTISDGGSPIGTAIVHDDGKWSFTPNPPLNDGKHDFTVVVTDPAGNTSEPSDPWTVVVDTQAPNAPVIVSVIDDQGDSTGPLTSGGAPTDDAQPQIIGTAEANSTVMIYDGATLIGSAPVDASGNWTFTPTTPLSNGGHSLTAKASDAAGNVSDPSNEFDLTVIAGGSPPAPAITGIFDDVGTVTGNVMPNGVTDDTQPEIRGTAQPGAIVSIFSDKLLLGSVTADGSGNWSFTPDTSHALSEGLHNISATATNAAGNISPSTGDYPITVDLTAPGVSTGDTLTDDVGPVTGPIADNGTTDDANPTYAGKAEPGSTVTVYDNGTLVGTAITNAAGDWSFTPNTPLADGPHVFTNTVSDLAGNTSPVSTPIHFTVDTSAVAISINLVTDDVGSVTGPISENGPTDDTRPTVSGIATAGSIVHIFVDGIEIGSTTASATGRWSFEPDAAHALIEGPHTITATAVNLAGVSSDSNPFRLVVDLTPPDRPVIGDVQDDVGAQQGTIPTGGSTDDSTPTLSGGGQTPGDTITVSDGGSPIGTAIVRDDGTWTFTPNPPLNDGSHQFTVVATDPAGNTSAPSDPWTVIIDTVAPGAPVIVSVIDDQGDVTGPLISGGDPTDDAQPQIIGTAEANSTVMIYDGATLIGSAPVDASGNWSFTPTTPLSNGGHSLTAKASDAAGNVSDPSNEFDLTVIAGGTPPAPAITGIFDDVGTVTGNVMPNGVTDDTRPEIRGTAQPGDTVSVFADTVLLGTVTADASGNWSFTPDAGHALAEGLHNITASATNAAGNISPTTGDYPITVDLTAPGVSTGDTLTDDVGPVTGPIADNSTTDDANPTYAGKAEPGSTVTVYDNGTLVGTAITNAAGDWSFTPNTPLADGPHVFTNTVSDPAGNTSPVSTPIHFIVDTSGVAVSITLVTDDVGSVTGPISNGGPTDDTRPTVSGNATAGSVVHVFVDGVEVGSTTADTTGRWSFEPDAAHALIEGPHIITATAVNLAGVSSDSNPFRLVVDLTPPDRPVIGDVQDDVGAQQGTIPTGGSTDDSTPTLSGGGQTPGDTITVSDGGRPIGTAIVHDDGTWTFTPNPPLNDGSHQFTVVATDPAGNSSAPSDPWTVIIDTVAPNAPMITGALDDVGSQTGNVPSGGITDDRTPLLSGTGEPGAIIRIGDSSTSTWLGSAVVQADGTWSLQVTTPLVDGTHVLNSQQTDAAGNVSPVSPVYTLIVDGTAPTAPTITGALDDFGSQTGNVPSGGVTDDRTPTLSGAAEANSRVMIYDGGVLIGSTIANASGTWSFDVPARTGDQQHVFTATATDAAGNASGVSNDYRLTFDTTPPGTPTITGALDDVAGGIVGNIPNNGLTNDRTPLLSGAAEANSRVTIYTDGGVILGTAITNAAGVWTFPVPSQSDGVHSFQVTATDQAGNSSGLSDRYSLTVDATPPAQPSITGALDNFGPVTGNVGNNGSTDDNTPRLSGNAEAGSTVVIYDGAAIIGSVVAGSGGTWTYDVPTRNLGSHAFSATATDAAGNTSVKSGNYTLNVVAPLPTSLTENFDEFALGNWSGGASATNPEGTLRVGASRNDNGTVATGIIKSPNTGGGNYLTARGGGNIYVDILKGGSATELTMDVGRIVAGTPNPNTAGGSTLQLFDASGKVVYSKHFGPNEITQTDPSGREGSAHVVIKLPAGVSFNKVVLTPDSWVGSSGLLYGTGGMDNMVFGGVSYPVGTIFGMGEVDQDVSGADGLSQVSEIQDDTTASEDETASQPDPVDVPPPVVVEATPFTLQNDSVEVHVEAAGDKHVLVLDGADQVLNLSALTEAEQAKIGAVEVIDITGTGDNTLNLTLSDVLEQGGKGLFIDDDKTQLMIKGNAGDVVNLDDLLADGSDTGDWAKADGAVTVEGVLYNVYQHSGQNAELLVQQGVETHLT